MSYSVTKSDEGQRLDVYLAAKTNATRSAVQKMIAAGRVFVNGILPKKTGYMVCEDDVIEVRDSVEPDVQDEKGKSFRVIAETPDYVVIEKPAGLVVHGGVSRKQVSLVDLLLKKYPEITGIGDDPLRPGIVHRLDKDASGVMVIAQTQDSFDSLKRQFKLRRVSKEYLILVHGVVEPAEGTINIPITRSAEHSTKFVGNMAGGRDAVTNYSVERVMDGYSLVRVRPETGRTHQIRVHFYSRGYPLVGDKVYVKKEKNTGKSERIASKSQSEEGRLMLHATLLEFRNLLGESQKYECPPGKDFLLVVADIDKN